MVKLNALARAYRKNKLIKKYENLAIKAYSKNQMLKGKVYEKRADRLYAQLAKNL